MKDDNVLKITFEPEAVMFGKYLTKFSSIVDVVGPLCGHGHSGQEGVDQVPGQMAPRVLVLWHVSWPRVTAQTC